MVFLIEIKTMFERKDGDKLCNSCFGLRQNNAKKIKTENIMTNNWGLYLIPIVSNALLTSRAIKCDKYPDGNVYHIYFDGWHEQWSNNSRHGNCVKCNKFIRGYYQLEKSEIDIFSFF